MYSLHAYGAMLEDRIRMDAYEQALRRTVKPGDVVLDIGTGTGVHALMAARFGARHVHAVEPADSVLLATRIARANGLDDRITFIQDLSTRITLPERADVIVSDLHGAIPWYGAHIPTIVDARERLLKKGGILIPQRDVVHMAVVESAKQHDRFAKPWTEQPYGFDMHMVAPFTTNSYYRVRMAKDDFLTEPVQVAELDYHTITRADVLFSASLKALRAGTVHGLLAWFDTVVHEDVRLTSAPWEPEISYGSAFFPFTQSLAVHADDVLHVTWQGVPHADDYVWSWSCEVAAPDGAVRGVRRQNSFASELLSMEKLRKRASSYRPRLDGESAIERTILTLMDGERSVEEIATMLHERHPDAFAGLEQALERVRDASARYG